MTRLRAVAFDLDGTLIDTAPDLADAVNAMLEALGLKALTEARIRGFIGDGVEQLVVRALTASLQHDPRDPAYIARALEEFRGIYALRLFQRSQVYAGVETALQALAGLGLTLCCITNKESVLALPLLQLAGLRRYLAFTLCPGQPSDRKPSPALLIAACARLAIRPPELLFVGDSMIDIRAGRAAGCPVASVNYGYGNGVDVEGHRVIDDLSELLTFENMPRR